MRTSGYLALVAVCSIVSACQQGPEAGKVWKLHWQVDKESRYLDARGAQILSRKPWTSGDEVWWVGEDRLIIDGRGQLSDGEESESRTWILLDKGWVVVLDYNQETLQAIPLERFDEERARQTRAWMIAAVAKENESGDRDFYRIFQGDLSLERHWASGRSSWRVFAAVPGRAWLLVGGSPRRLRAPAELLALGFEGVSRKRADAVGTVLNQFSPGVVEVISVPDRGPALVVRRELARVTWGDAAEPMIDYPEEAMAERQRREQGWRDFRTLWRFLENPDSRPATLDLRGIRLRLERVVSPFEVPIIRDRLRSAVDQPEKEELFMLLRAADRGAFRIWWEAALVSGNLPQLLTMISVLSLREPERVPARIDAVLAQERIWSALTPASDREARIWLEGVRRWVQPGPGPGPGPR